MIFAHISSSSAEQIVDPALIIALTYHADEFYTKNNTPVVYATHIVDPYFPSSNRIPEWKDILEKIKALKPDDVVYVQCHLGRSRSNTIASALHKHFEGSELKFAAIDGENKLVLIDTYTDTGAVFKMCMEELKAAASI